ncbi:MAG: sensor histidine kinase, partial [Bryobacteraceae bacterium]
CTLRAGTLRCFGRESGLRSTQIRAFHQDRRGRIWVGTRAGGLHLFDSRRFRPFPLAGLMPALAVRAIVEDRHGNLWVGTEGAGMIRIREGATERLTTREGLPHNFVRALFEDREGNLWVGTRGGLLRLRDLKVQTWTTTEGLIHDEARTVLAEPSGRVWIGTRAGLNFVENGAVRSVRLSHEWSRDSIRSLALAPDGAVWIGADTGLFRWQAGVAKPVPLPGPGHSPPVRMLYFDRSGTLWLGLWNRLLSFTRGGFSDRTPRLPGPPSGISSMTEGADGTLWIGAEDGLVQLTKDSARRFTSRDGLSHDRVTSLYLDGEGTLWIGTRGGLTCLRNGRFSVLRRSHGLLSDNILHVSEDLHGHFWLTSRRGVMRISRRELIDFIEGRTAELHPVGFDTSDGMRSVECGGDAFPAGARDQQGRMWFPTTAGVVVFDPRNLQTARTPPRVMIEQVAAGGRLWPATAGQVRLGAGNATVEVQFTAISLGSPERIRFRYLLEGHDREWNESVRSRTAVYSNLPPGTYRFRVVADARDGAWPTEEAAIGLVLEPRFHQTLWFYLLCAAAAAGLLWAAWSVRLIGVRRRYEAVMEERTRIAREVHDTLMQGVTGVSLQLETVSKRMLTDPGEAKRRMDHALARLDEVIAEARRTILELRSAGDSAADIGSALRATAQEIAAVHGLQIEVRIEGRPQRLPQAVASHLLKIAREAVLNSARHAHASSIELCLQFGKDSLRLLAADDGCGFDASHPAGTRFGLKGMQERAAAVGGRLRIQSSPGAGTRIEFEAPLASIR